MEHQENIKTYKGMGKISAIVFLILALLVIGFLFYRISRRLGSQMINSGTSVTFIAENMEERVSQIEKNKDFTSDFSFPLFNNGDISFHIHALQVGQISPLHVHKESEEAVLIIKGKGKIKSLSLDDSSLEKEDHIQEFIIDRGGFFYAPPGNAHEFLNSSQNEPLACLVIHRPPFHGNLYVKEKDVARSPPATYQNLISIAHSMVGAGEGEAAVAKITGFSRIEMRLIRTFSELDHHMSRGHDLVIIFLQGKATLDIANSHVKLKRGSFIGIPTGTPFRILPSRSSGDCYLLCFYLNQVPGNSITF